MHYYECLQIVEDIMPEKYVHLILGIINSLTLFLITIFCIKGVTLIIYFFVT